jgi:cysteine synthase
MSRLRVLFGLALCAAFAARTAADARRTVTPYGRLPLTFEKNTGRYDKRVRFLTRTRGATIFLTANEMVMVLPGKATGTGHDARGAAIVPSPRLRGEGQGEGLDALSALGPQPSAASRHVLRMKLVGASAKAVATGLDKQPGIVNYFIGNDPKKWRTRVPTYARARFAGVYPGIDVVYYSAEARGKGQEPRTDAGRAPLAPSTQVSALEYDFVVKPGADPRRIQLAFEGAERIRVASGDLVLSTPVGDVRLKRPYAYQTVAGQRVQVACDYALTRSAGVLPATAVRRVGLRLVRYDATKPLVVDPVLVYSTFLGGASDEVGRGIAVDPTGRGYVAGCTYSGDFPTTAGAYAETYAGAEDLFVAKLNGSGSALEYCTYIGGSGADVEYGMAATASGAVCITGYTDSTNFPVTAGALDQTQNGGWDAFVTMLGPGGTALAYSTFLGAAGSDYGYAIAVDSASSAYVVGVTSSSSFPTTPAAWDTSYGGFGDAFISKLATDGSALVWSTYLGGTDHDWGYAIAVDGVGAAYVAGATFSLDFPFTTGAYDTHYHGDADAFVTKVAPDGATLAYSTCMGGPGEDRASGVAVRANGVACVTGRTRSTTFPTTPDAFDVSHNGGADVFVAGLVPSGGALQFSTFVGGSGDDIPLGVALDSAGAGYVAGYTNGTDYPTTLGAHDDSANGSWDVFVTKVDPGGSLVEYSTYLGGQQEDHATAIAVDAAGAAFVTGYTNSSDFPVSPGAHDTSASGGSDVFVTKLALGPLPTSVFVLDRAGTITELVVLRGYLRRVVDSVWLLGRSLRFAVDGTGVGTSTTNASGRADLPWVITDGPATRTILAEFAGDAAYLPSSGTATLTALTVNTKMAGYDRAGRITEGVLLRAVLRRTDNTPVRSKVVTFAIDGTAIGSATTNTDGRALLGHTIADGPGSGTRVILAEWPGDGGYRSSAAANTLFVGKALPYIWVLPKSVPLGGSFVLYGYFRRLDDYQIQPGQEVVFRVDGTVIATITTDATGIARHTYRTVEPVGEHTIRCEFAGNAWVEAGYGEATLTVY